MKNIKDTTIKELGTPSIPSPLQKSREYFRSEGENISIYSSANDLKQCYEEIGAIPFFEKVGAREKIFFNPKETVVGIVTCGGLCPGLNDVIRAVCITALKDYGVKKVLGFRYGYQGLSKNSHYPPMDLTEDSVKDINILSGTILGTSRGAQDIDEMIDTLKAYEVNALIVIGGDGTLRGAHHIANRIIERQEKISVVGVPKTIDNDICWISRSFGFLTAVTHAKVAVDSAHAEARSAYNGIGIVKLMGRDSGFIAARVTLACSNVNFCLIPEVDFDIEGEGGLLEQLKDRLLKKQHAVIVVAEGAGQKYFNKDALGKDLSGNQRMGDIGILLKNKIKKYLSNEGMEHTIKYIDPSYIIRSQIACATDAEFCLILGSNAVHAAMAGKTDMAVGKFKDSYAHIPIDMIVGGKKRVRTDGELWETVTSLTCQNFEKNNQNQ